MASLINGDLPQGESAREWIVSDLEASLQLPTRLMRVL